MSTTRRRSRRRIEDRDPITLHWDEGLPPPVAAFAPENHERVQEVVFFRWAEADRVPTYGKDHPHLGAWLAVLRQ